MGLKILDNIGESIKDTVGGIRFSLYTDLHHLAPIVAANEAQKFAGFAAGRIGVSWFSVIRDISLSDGLKPFGSVFFIA